MRSENNKIRFLFVRVTALALCLLALQKAGAGACLARGQGLLDSGRYDEALALFGKGLRWDGGDAGLSYRLAVALWESGRAGERPARVAVARRIFRRLADEQPGHSRAWLYAGITELYLVQRSAGRIDASRWEKAQADFERALAADPGSAWTKYMVGIQRLSHAGFLSQAQKDEALDLVRRGIEGTPVYYHRDTVHLSALNFLRGQCAQMTAFEAVTPDDYASRLRLIRFLESRGLWKFRCEATASFLGRMRREYDERMNEGIRLLDRKRFRAADEEFQKAHWIDQGRPAAGAGMAICRRKGRGASPEAIETIRRYLENEEGDIPELLPYLDEGIGDIGDPYLTALYHFRRGDFETAVRNFEKVKPEKDPGRRTYALCLRSAGKEREAVEVLAPCLREPSPDLRNLWILREWKNAYTAEAESALRVIAEMPLNVWMLGASGKTTASLETPDSAGMVVQLRPEQGRLRLRVRSTATGEETGAAVEIKLWDGPVSRILGAFFVEPGDWNILEMPFRNSGGPRWLEVRLLNGAPAGKAGRGVTLELGRVEILP